MDTLQSKIAEHIFNCEARRDRQGRAILYKLPKEDGGGTEEYAGINDKYNPYMLGFLKTLLDQGLYDQAEARAKTFIISLTQSPITLWNITNPAMEACIRDIVFHRGIPKAEIILQLALGVEPDGKIGPITKAALATAQQDPADLLYKLRAAREHYERQYAHRNETSKLWTGLVNRWNKTLTFSLTLLEE